MDSFTDELSEATPVTGEFRHLDAALRGISLLKCLKIIATRMKSSQNPTETSSPEKSYEATKPLDKVYGILGLLRGYGVTPQLEIRYDWTVFEVNRSIDQERRFDLPSWAPDFTIPTNYLSIFRDMRYAPKWSDKIKVARERSGTFAFTGDSQSCCKFDLMAKTITVTGFRVDMIQKVETRLVDIMPNFKVDRLVRYGKRIGWLPPDEAEESELEEVWNSFLGHEPTQARAWVGAEKVGIEGSFPRPLLKPQCFQTANMGLYGTTDAAICVNDHICGLLGLGVPCILRWQGHSWRFVGLR
ncbi:hypothetical protein N431DRAFT_559189 [Stipitochalara longipes BDJ]|nr:hypothetical protein N431DRAFT_559189 [Stipitochalara longipes BDJ]